MRYSTAALLRYFVCGFLLCSFTPIECLTNPISRQRCRDCQFYVYTCDVCARSLAWFKEQHQKEIWDGEFGEVLAHGLEEIWIHSLLLSHPRRVLDISEADFYYVPFYYALNRYLGERNGTTPESRLSVFESSVKVLGAISSVPELHFTTISHWDIEHLLGESSLLLEYISNSALTVANFECFNLWHDYSAPPHVWLSKGDYFTKKAFNIPWLPNLNLYHDAHQGLVPAHKRNRTFNFVFRGSVATWDLKSSSGFSGWELRSQIALLPLKIPGVIALDIQTDSSKPVLYDYSKIGGLDLRSHNLTGGNLTYSHSMFSGLFCFHVRGDAPTARRLFDSILSGCIPIIISDDLPLPFVDLIDYSAFSVFVPEKVWMNNPVLVCNQILSLPKPVIVQMQNALHKVRDKLIYGLFGSPPFVTSHEFPGYQHTRPLSYGLIDLYLSNAFSTMLQWKNSSLSYVQCLECRSLNSMFMFQSMKLLNISWSRQ